MSHSEIGEVIAPRSQFYHGPYGRMFRNLPPHVPTLNLLKQFDGEFSENDIAQINPDTDKGREAILKLLARTMIETYEQSTRDDTRDNKYIPAGYTYFGQFITHDITFDPTSSLMRFNDPDKVRNFRTPRLDLDSLYGGGPEESPYFYDRHEYGKLLVGKGTLVWRHRDTENPSTKIIFRLEELALGDGISKVTHEEDLPRNSQGCAIIGDPRNDENVIISQLQLAFIKFHNTVLDYVTKNENLHGKYAFHRAQQLVRWHYQWVILHDFLPKIVEEEILRQIWNEADCWQPNLCFYQWRDQPFIPVEFSVAAFRFGHSMIRAIYDLNDGVAQELMIVECTGPSRHNLIGSRPLLPGWTIQWDLFFNPDNPGYQKSRQIDTNLSFPLGQIPPHPGDEGCHNLAEFDLLRGYRMELPSGQDVAKAMGIQKADMVDGPELPLWYYILKEAEEKQKERIQKQHKDKLKGKLGLVGGRIVAEVIIGLLAGDPHSFLNVDPWWYPKHLQKNPVILKDREHPFILRRNENSFKLSDILALANPSPAN